MMSYASSSSKTLSQGYDVFISFRGEDTRMGFTSHLYDALTRKRIRTYKDDKSLEIGSFISPELLEAIDVSSFAIVVLSRNFATSKWCLEEIAKVVDCMEQGKLIVIPVFYHVSPSDVRHQSNCFQQSFANHEVNPEIKPQKVETWRAAFTKVGAISGLHVTEHRNESQVIHEIVAKILKDKHDTLPMAVTNRLVGIEARVHEVKRMLFMESSEVRFIGICGMSGVGKTTLAEVVYEAIRNQFEESSFIENIKDISKDNNSSKLCKLQRKLLNDILKDESIRVGSVKIGQSLLGTKLRRLKVLIVLDDVNHADQLKYLAGESKWFGRGTRIIVTTTDMDLLNSFNINEIYRCEELKDDEALKLFCQSAFNEGHPTHGFEKLSDDIVKLSGGLPLALNVYGSLLHGKEESYWKEMSKKVQKYPQKEVVGRLEIGYARLDDKQQDIFRCIACFLKGRDIDLVKDILTDVGLYPECGISDLINKFLVTINPDDSVWMHDLLQQMCWEVLRKESHRYDEKYIAIKSRQDIVDILSSKPKGMRTIEIINQEPYKVEVDDFFDDPTCFSKMKKLKFLRISNIHFRQGLHYLSNDLRILEWHGCSLKYLPATFEPKHIFELEMCYSQLETLWEKDLDLPNLRSINLSFSKNLAKIADLTSTANLVKLNLEGCTKLTELHESVLLQKRLQYMNLKGCVLLQNLGRCNMEMEALETLILSGCSNLAYIPEFGQNMKCLEHLYVDGTNIKKLPENMGQMCNLRKLDASETPIEQVPSSIHHLKRLRVLRVHRCQLSSQGRGFLYTNLDTISFLRELDLSYCNLSEVPDGIGLLYRLVNLDLSGNDIVSLPASMTLLSNLRMLCLNNCKSLKSLPKLSIVNEDTLYGLQIRVNYYISGEGPDVSNFQATRENNSPTVSCLNCPKLAQNERGSYLAGKVLNSYLQLRTKYWMAPEAVFEIFGVGSKIPSGFELLRSDETFILDGPWVGVAICAVIAAHHQYSSMEAKYVVTAHIHVGEKHWMIPVPINLLVAGLENQLLFYWTVADDLQRTVDSDQRNNFSFSFSVEPGDGKLQVTKFGVRFIHDDDILQLKRLEDSTTEVVHNMFRATLFLPTDLKWYIRACEADTDLHFFHSTIQDLTIRMIRFTLNYGKQQYSLDGIQRIINCLIEVNQQVLSECKEEWRHRELFSMVYEYYRISHATSELYNYFVRLLKDMSDSWLSVKLALEQIVVKSRADHCTHEEILQQLHDIEAAESVKLSDNFVIMFAYICKQTVAFSKHINETIKRNDNFKSPKVLAKVSSITIAVVISIVATYFRDMELLQEMKGITSYSKWLHVIQSFSRKSDKWLVMIEHHMKLGRNTELRISDFCGNADLLRELRNKMRGSTRLTDENEEIIRSVIDNLEMKTNNISTTIEAMCSHAHKYSDDTRETGMFLNPFIADGYLQVSKAGVCFIRDEDTQQLKQNESCVSEAMSILFRITSSIPLDLPWFLCACGADNGLHSCHPIIHDHTSSVIKFFLDYGKQRDSLDGIRKIFECLHKINQEALIIVSDCIEECSGTGLFPLYNDYNEIISRTSQLYYDFVRLLKDISDNWSSLKSALQEIVLKIREKDCPYEEMVQKLNDLGAAESVRISYHSFANSFACTCDQAIVYLTGFYDKMQANENLKSVKVVAEVSRVTISGVFSVMATYMGDSRLLQELTEISSNSMFIDLIKRVGGEWFSERGVLMKRSYGGELQIWDFYGDAIVDKLKKMAWYGCYTPEIEEEMMIVIGKLEWKIDNFSETIEDMHTHAHLDEDIHLLKRYEDFVSEAMSTLYRATASFAACEADIDLYSCHSIVPVHTSNTIKFFLDYEKQRDYLDGILKLFKCLHELNLEAFTISNKVEQKHRHIQFFPLGEDYYHLSSKTFKFYEDFVSLLACISRSWLSVKLALEKFVVESRADNYTDYEEKLENLNHLDTSVKIFYSRFSQSFVSICQQTISFLKRFNEMLQRNEKLKSVKTLAEVSRLTIVGVFSLLATYMGDYELLQLLKDITSNFKLFELIQSISNKGGKWFSEKGELMKRSYVGELQIWDFYGDAILHELKKKIALCCFTEEIEEVAKIVIDKLETTISNFSETIEDMLNHAHKYQNDIWRSRFDAWTQEWIMRSQFSLTS